MENPYAVAQQTIDSNLGDLPAKVLAELREGRRPPEEYFAEWCADHPTETVRIVGALALLMALTEQ